VKFTDHKGLESGKLQACCKNGATQELMLGHSHPTIWFVQLMLQLD
jgi:hypothetical protein